MNIASLNTMHVEPFTEVLGDVFEHSPWVARGAWASRPFADIEALHAAMTAVVARSGAAQQLALLRSHPELAGRQAQQGDLTAASAGEQARAGLNALSATEFTRITELNAAYLSRHGFPFIVCVGEHNRASLMQAFERRAANSTALERPEALDQVYRIARLRLQRLLAAG